MSKPGRFVISPSSCVLRSNDPPVLAGELVEVADHFAVVVAEAVIDVGVAGGQPVVDDAGLRILCGKDRPDQGLRLGAVQRAFRVFYSFNQPSAWYIAILPGSPSVQKCRLRGGH